MTKRQERITQFDEFYKTANETFEEIASNDKSHKRIKSLFSFYVAPGGRLGGVNKKVIEIFYGSRPIDTTVKLESNFQKKETADIATGATLQYSRTDNGHVVCSLCPAKSENQRPYEDLILLDFINNPADLKKRIKSHWKMFIAYMETTCIDGEPSFIQRTRALYLRNFKRYVANNIEHERKVKLFFIEIAKYSLTIGFSGFLLFLITEYRYQSKSLEEKLYRENVFSEISGINKNTKNISGDTLKSIAVITEIRNEATKTNDKLNELKETESTANIELKNINKSIRTIKSHVHAPDKATNK